jgi:hypothetical protein
MTTPLVVNGVTYNYPQDGEESGWGPAATAWAQAVTQYMLQKTGGSFSLSAEVNFGGVAGLKTLYYKSQAATPAASGVVRLGNDEAVAWRNAAGSADLSFKVNASDQLEFGGNPLLTLALGAADAVLKMNTGGTAYEFGKISNANVDASAAIAYSKLNLAGSVVNADIATGAAIAYSKLNLSGSIVNADVGASAAIAYSKLNLATSIVNADISGSAAIAYSKLNLATSIVNADIASGAAIARSKVASGTADHVLINDGSGNLSSEASLAVTRGGTGQTTANAGFAALSPMTTNGDLITRASGVPARLPIGVDGQVMTVVSGAPAWSDGGAGGSGELNMVTNPSGASDVTGWSTTGANGPTVARTTTSGDLPLENQISTALKLTSAITAGAEASHYLATTLTPGEALKNRKHKIDIYMRPGTNFIASEWTVSVYSGSTRMPLSTDSSGVTYLPNATGKFTTTFDADSSSSYTLRFSRPVNAGGNAAVLNVTSVIVGPGIQPQGAVVSAWQSYTPTTQGFGTISDVVAYWRRVGSTIEIQGRFDTGSTTGSEARLYLPSGLTASGGTSNTVIKGRWFRGINSASARKAGTLFLNSTAGAGGYLLYGSDDFTAAQYPYIALAGNSVFGSTNATFFHATGIEVDQWDGSGNVSLAQADSQEIVIAHNSATDSGQALAVFNVVQFDTETADSAGRFSANTFTAVNAGYYQVETTVHLVTGTSFSRALVSLYKNGSELTRFIDDPTARGSAVDISYSGSATVKLAAGDTLDVRVFASGVGTYSISGGAADTRISIKRVSVDGQVIGFGEVVPGISSGLVSANGLKGRTDGAAVPAGYVGESLTTSSGPTSCSTGSDTTVATRTLTVGIWLVSATLYSDGNTGVYGGRAKLFVKGSFSNVLGDTLLQTYDDGASGARMGTSLTFPPRVVVITSGDADKTVQVKSNPIGSTSNCSAFISAVLIA